MRVVVAEDHVLLRDGLTRLLRAYGCEVVAALEGRTLSLTRSLESRDFSSSQGWSSVRFPAAAFISLLPTARFLSPMATVLLLATVADTTKLPGRCYSTHSRLVRSLEFRGVSGSWFGSNDQSAHG